MSIFILFQFAQFIIPYPAKLSSLADEQKRMDVHFRMLSMRFFAVTGRVLNDALVKICKLNKALFVFFPVCKETLSC